MSAQALIDALAAYDVKAERKSIYDDSFLGLGYPISSETNTPSIIWSSPDRFILFA